MTHDRLHALVARCLSETSFLSSALSFARAAEDSVPDFYVSPDLTDAAKLIGRAELERLAFFRGFIVKIKHNSLRPVLPLTFRALADIDGEIAFFASYADVYMEARASGPIPTTGLLSLLVANLRSFLAGHAHPFRKLVSDVLIHESTLAHVLERQAPSGNITAIRWRGVFETRRYESDVLAACSALRERAPWTQAAALSEAYVLAYWCPIGASDVALFEIDEATELIFSLVDGQRDIVAVAGQLATLGLQDIDTSSIFAFFSEAEQRGFLDIGGCQKGARTTAKVVEVPECA